MPQCTRPGSWAGGARRPQSRDRCPASTRHFCASAACSCRTGGPRHLGASGHRDQKQGHRKTPTQHDTVRAHEAILRLMYWLISHPRPELPGGGATLFLAGANHGCCEIVEQTRRHPPICRRAFTRCSGRRWFRINKKKRRL